MSSQPPSDNPDPLTGEPGSHPVATGVGAATGGVAGAAIGTLIAGPLGGLVGAAAGAMAGGAGGKAAGEAFDPTAEDAYWRDSHSKQPYATPDDRYEDYQPAYRIGYEGAFTDLTELGTFEEAEPELRNRYEAGRNVLPWMKVRVATQSAWTRARGQHGSIRTSGGVY
jgi:hypothetical protein